MLLATCAKKHGKAWKSKENHVKSCKNHAKKYANVWKSLESKEHLLFCIYVTFEIFSKNLRNDLFGSWGSKESLAQTKSLSNSACNSIGLGNTREQARLSDVVQPKGPAEPSDLVRSIQSNEKGQGGGAAGNLKTY